MRGPGVSKAGTALKAGMGGAEMGGAEVVSSSSHGASAQVVNVMAHMDGPCYHLDIDDEADLATI